jgi:SAM-dependent methyltransferase
MSQGTLERDRATLVDGNAEQGEIVPEASQWEEAWTSGTAPIPEVHEDMIRAISTLMDLDGKMVLEVGSGTGHDSVALASMGAQSFALDLTPIALEMTRQNSQEHDVPVHLLAGDTLVLPFPSDSFDLVFSQGLLEHFSNPALVIREQARVVRPGGYLLVDVPQRYSFYTRHKHRLMAQGAWFAGWETEFSMSELISLLRSSGLEPARSYGYGYFPAVLSGVRNAHTIDRRRFTSFRLPDWFGSGVERFWCTLERRRWYHRWLTNIGVIAKKNVAEASSSKPIADNAGG